VFREPAASGEVYIGRGLSSLAWTCVQVSIEDAKKALNEQYGGEDENPPPGTGFNTFKFTKYSNAYMLVYVRASDWNRVRILSHSCLLTSSKTFNMSA